jgi:hypothetical protein
MMFTNMFVHILEVVVALLVIATVVQVFRCNRTRYKTIQTPNILPSLSLDLPKHIEKEYGTSANILHDYIGEFFIDATRADQAIADELKVYKNAEAIKVELVRQAKLTVADSKGIPETPEKLESKNSERSNIFSFEERADVAPDNVFSEDEDDSVITVMSASSAPSGVADDKFMSNKVVHAMLDEAKLVCAS